MRPPHARPIQPEPEPESFASLLLGLASIVVILLFVVLFVPVLFQ